MCNDTKEDISVHGYKTQGPIYRPRGQRTVFAQSLLRHGRKLDHALGSEAIVGARARAGAGTGGGDRGERTISDGLVGGGAVAEDEGMVVGDDGNGAVGVVADQETTRFVERGRLAAPKGSVGVHARAVLGVILCVRICVGVGGV